MSAENDPKRGRDHANTLMTIANDSTWSAVFGAVIIAGLALAALFFFVNSGDNTPTAQATTVEDLAPGASPARSTRLPSTRD
jgi:hypothetical protein